MEPPIGIKALDIEPGDHVLAVITGNEEDGVVPMYAQSSLAAGDRFRVLCSVQETTAIRAQLATLGVDVPGAERTGQLRFSRPSDYADPQAPSFNVSRLVERIRHEAGRAMASDGAAHLRYVLNISWLRELGAAYEDSNFCSAISAACRDYSVSMLSVLDSRRFGGGALVRAMFLYPKVWLKGIACLNPFQGQGHPTQPAPSHV